MADPTFKKTSVTQKFNFKEMFGVIPTPEIRKAIGQKILDTIKDRTEGGKGFGGKAFKASKYSESYADSLEFKAFGKSQGEVNMELTGDMLGLMDIIDETSQTITIGWTDAKENAKAFNHNTGDTVPERPFFGLSDKEIKAIAKEFKADVQSSVRDSRANGRDDSTSRALDFLSRLGAKKNGPDGE